MINHPKLPEMQYEYEGVWGVFHGTEEELRQYHQLPWWRKLFVSDAKGLPVPAHRGSNPHNPARSGSNGPAPGQRPAPSPSPPPPPTQSLFVCVVRPGLVAEQTPELIAALRLMATMRRPK